MNISDLASHSPSSLSDLIGEPSASSIRYLVPRLRWLDVLLPPLLILLSIVLDILYNDRDSSSEAGEPAVVGAHLYRAKTSHARFVPDQAKHRFSYPVLFLGIDLDRLEHEQKLLDRGRWFRYNSERWSWMAIRSKVYLEPPSSEHSRTSTKVDPDTTTIKSKILNHLKQRNIPIELAEKVYTVTMPAFIGMQDINPLTIHYLYSITDSPSYQRKLNLVVLEVSNTFGEKHLYVLQCGIEEDHDVTKGFEHQWTFPRAFHVSPFNDRTGYYQVSIVDPLSSPSSSATTGFLSAHSNLNIKIVFLLPDKTKKFFADLQGQGEPLRPSSILSAILKWPLTLLLTTPRILYQAMLLHYRLRLDVYPRPEPFVETNEQQERDGVINPVERGGKAANIQWQEEGSFERFCREKVIRFLTKRVQETKAPIKITIRPADLSKEPTIIASTSTSMNPSVLAIDYFSHLFWVDLYTSPSIRMAIELGSKTEQRWTTSNDTQFMELFSPTEPRNPPPLYSRSLRLIRYMRLQQIRWALSFDRLVVASSQTSLPPHPLDSIDSPTLSEVQSLFFHFFFVRLGYWIFLLFRARFVVGTEPWQEWCRWHQKFGSSSDLQIEVGSSGHQKEEGGKAPWRNGVGSVLRVD